MPCSTLSQIDLNFSGFSSIKPHMNLEERAYFREKLKNDFCQKQRKNPSYSLRAYAKFLGIHSATLSCVLKSQRTLPLASAEKISNKLELSPKEKDRFVSSIFEIKSLKRLSSLPLKPKKEELLLDQTETQYKILSEWEHYAILSLLECDDFKTNMEWISQRLGITKLRAEQSIQKLKDARLIKVSKNGKIQKTFEKLKTSEDIASKAIQKSHHESLEIAQEKLKIVPVEKRDYSTVTFAADPRHMEEAKTLIREFRKRLARLMEDGRKTEVYRLSIELYPLTELHKKE